MVLSVPPHWKFQLVLGAGRISVLEATNRREIQLTSLVATSSGTGFSGSGGLADFLNLDQTLTLRKIGFLRSMTANTPSSTRHPIITVS